MSNFSSETDIGRVFPGLSDKCIARCPRITSILPDLMEIERLKEEIAEHGMSDHLEDEIKEAIGLLPAEIAATLDSQGSVTMARMMCGKTIELLDGLKTVGEQEINATGNGCDGPLEAVGTDCEGRMIGAFICRSPFALDGESREIANVFRY